MRLLFLAAGVEGPSFRFRMRQFIPYLERAGITVEVAELAVGGAERGAIFARAGEYDSVLVHRALLPPLEHWLLRRKARGYLFDFDDAIMFRDSAARNMHSMRRMARFRRMVRGAKAVIAGNAYLQSWAAPLNPRTTVLPTSIELAHYPPLAPEGVREPIIGWIGTRVNLMYLAPLYPAFAQIGRWEGQAPETDRPRLKVVCDAFPEIPGILVEKKVWTLAEEASDVCSFQVGIMPLPDDIWTRGKCGLKLLQYMAAGVPVVCSPVGTNATIVKNEINGLTATTSTEWADCLQRLLADPALRTRLRLAGRTTVENHYSMTANAPKMIALLKSSQIKSSKC